MNEHISQSFDFSKDLRTLVHDVRGSVGIISSSIEMLKEKDFAGASFKYFNMMIRQNYRILMETELFGAMYSLKEEIFPINRMNIKETLEEVILLSESGTKIISSESDDSFYIECPIYLIKLVFMSVLLPPTGLNSDEPIILSKQDNHINVKIAWNKEIKFIPKHIWAKRLMEHFSMKFELNRDGTFLEIRI